MLRAQDCWHNDNWIPFPPTILVERPVKQGRGEILHPCCHRPPCRTPYSYANSVAGIALQSFLWHVLRPMTPSSPVSSWPAPLHFPCFSPLLLSCLWSSQWRRAFCNGHLCLGKPGTTPVIGRYRIGPKCLWLTRFFFPVHVQTV